MSDFRENYFKARDAVAIELKKKYNFIETHRDNNRLTLDSSSRSFHLSFYLPDGKDLFITKKGELPNSNESFLAYVFKHYDNDISKAQNALKETFSSLANLGEAELNSEKVLKNSYILEIRFLAKHYPSFFT